MKKGVKVVRSVTINRPAAELFSFWRKLDNLPKFMGHVEEVQVVDNRTSHWMAKGPAGRRLEWDAEIVNEEPNQRIAWRSREGADVEQAGSVRFQAGPGGRGTEVTVSLEYTPPDGIIGRTAARLFGEEPGSQLQEDLNRFKALMETGEIPMAPAQFVRS